jgi:hypothetical protein
VVESTSAAAAAAADAVDDDDDAKDDSSIASEDLCGVCLDAPNALHVTSCKHQLCISCYKQLVKAAAAAAAAAAHSRRQPAAAGDLGCAACPFCRKPMAGFRYSAWVTDEQGFGA